MTLVADEARPAVAEAADAPEVRDTSAIDAVDWPHRPLAHPTTADRLGRFQVVFRQSALDAIHLHGQTRTDVELCGVLIGSGCRDERGPYLLVEHAIAGVAASSRSTNVTFTADTWQQIQTVMDRDFPDKKMIGWYHTHPGFGIFLSDMDVFICDNFFNLPWQVAFVYDPIGGDEGNFVWRDGRPTREPVLLEDDVTPRSADVPLMPLAEAMTGSDPAESNPADVAASMGAGAGEFGYTPATAAPLLVPDAAGDLMPPPSVAALESQVIELMDRVRRLENRQRPLLVAVVFLLAFTAMWAIEQWPIGSTPPPPAPAPSQAVGQAVEPTPAGATQPPAPVTPRTARPLSPSQGH